MRNFFIRFGDIPEDEASSVWNGEELVGKEKGVSVYPAILDEKGEATGIGLWFPINRTTLYTFQHLLEYDTRPCYLVEGDELPDRGVDGEPLIVNVKIIREIKEYRKKV